MKHWLILPSALFLGSISMVAAATITTTTRPKLNQPLVQQIARIYFEMQCRGRCGKGTNWRSCRMDSATGREIACTPWACGIPPRPC